MIGCRGFVIRNHFLHRRWIELAIGIGVEVKPASDFSIPTPLGKQVGGGITVAITAKRDNAILEGRLAVGDGFRETRGRGWWDNGLSAAGQEADSHHQHGSRYRRRHPEPLLSGYQLEILLEFRTDFRLTS